MSLRVPRQGLLACSRQLLRSPGYSGSQHTAPGKEQASRDGPGVTESDQLKSGQPLGCQAHSRVAPANGVASWQQRQDPRSNPRPGTGWAASGLTKATSSWPGATVSLPGWPLRPTSLALPTPPASGTSSHRRLNLLCLPTENQHTGAQGTRLDQVTRRRQEHARKPGPCRGWEEPEQAGGTRQEVAAESPETNTAPQLCFRASNVRETQSGFSCNQKLLEHWMDQQKPGCIRPPCTSIFRHVPSTRQGAGPSPATLPADPLSSLSVLLPLPPPAQPGQASTARPANSSCSSLCTGVGPLAAESHHPIRQTSWTPPLPDLDQEP